jgi:hypothetical protein
MNRLPSDVAGPLLRAVDAMISEAARSALASADPAAGCVYVFAEDGGASGVTVQDRRALIAHLRAWAAPDDHGARLVASMLALDPPPASVRVLLHALGTPGALSAFIWREGWTAPPADARAINIALAGGTEGSFRG